MERFALSIKAGKTKTEVVVGIYPTACGQSTDKPMRSVTVVSQGKGYSTDKMKVLTEVLDRRVADAGENLLLNIAAGSKFVLEHEDGMRVYLATVLGRKCNTLAKVRAVGEGLAYLPSEVVLYWFTLCVYGSRQKAGIASLFTLLTHKG